MQTKSLNKSEVTKKRRRISQKSMLLMAVGLFLAVTAGSIIWQVLPAQAASLGNLVGYWKFDEATAGTTPADSSGNANTLALVNTPMPSNDVPAAMNQAFPDMRSLSFNGLTQFAWTSAHAMLNNAGPVSVSAWVKFNSVSGNQTIIAKWQVGVHQQWVLQLNGGHISWWTGDGNTGSDELASTTPISAHAWYHLVATATNGSKKLYINGSADASNTAGSIGSNAVALAMGGKANSSGTYFEFLNGKLDDVRVYNRVLSAAEASELASGDNTTAIWTGVSDYNYNNPANWDINAVPDSHTNIVVPKAASSVHWPSFYSDVGMANLDNQGLIYLGDYDLTFNDGGKLSNTGTFQLNGDNILTNFVNDTDSGEVTYSGPSSYASLPTGDSYYDLTFDKGTGTGTWSLPSGTTLTVAHNFSFKNGVTFNAGNGRINLSGNWNNSGGTFNAGTSTVDLIGSGAQQISGNNTFYNFGKSSSSGGSILFQSGSTQTITENLILEGSSNSLLQLGSTSTGTQWKINPEGNDSIGFVSVQDSDNISAVNTPIVAAGSSSGGNNTGWDIAGPTISDLGPGNYVDGSWSNDNTPTLTFTTADDDSLQVKYEIQIDNNSDFSSPEVDQTSNLIATGIISFTAPSTLADGSYYWRVMTTDDNSLSSEWVTANSDAVAFEIDTSAPDAPSADPVGGTYANAQNVTLSATDNGSGIAAIYYTTDGSTPTSSSIKYTSEISVAKSETIKAIAYDKAGNTSRVTSVNYMVKQSTASKTTADSSTSVGDKENSTEPHGSLPTSKASPSDVPSQVATSSLASSSTVTSDSKDKSKAPSLPTVKFENDSASKQPEQTINNQNTSAFLGLGWWWLLIIAVVVSGWWLIAKNKRYKKNKSDN